jgi:hypothetical protein
MCKQKLEHGFMGSTARQGFKFRGRGSLLLFFFKDDDVGEYARGI